MLVMIPKEVTADKGPNVVFGLGAGFMRIILRMLAPVRQISAKVEKLERSQYGRQHPEQHHVLQRKVQLEHVKRDGHEQELPPSNVLFQEAEVPGPERAVVVIRVLVSGYVAVVLVVPGQQARVPVIGKQKSRNHPDILV